MAFNKIMSGIMAIIFICSVIPFIFNFLDIQTPYLYIGWFSALIILYMILPENIVAIVSTA